MANDAKIAEDGSEWKPVWRHDTELGHDKALSISEARTQAKVACDDDEIPLIIFIGDGVSDLPAAREADVLFARKGLRLEEYCVENMIPYIGFETFADIEREVEKIMKEDDERTGGFGKPVRFNPRANLWRRVSSQKAVSTTSHVQVFGGQLLTVHSFQDMSSLHRRRRRRCSSGPMLSQSISLRLLRRVLLPSHGVILRPSVC